MFVLRMLAVAMAVLVVRVMLVIVFVVLLLLELVVAQLGAQLLLHDLPILDGEHQVVMGLVRNGG